MILLTTKNTAVLHWILAGKWDIRDQFRYEYGFLFVILINHENGEEVASRYSAVCMYREHVCMIF